MRVLSDRKRMLAFDIETEGLLKSESRVIAASVYDPARGIKRTFHFMKDPYKYESERDEFIQTMDEAECLCSFNGVRFDIPFIAYRCWMQKSVFLATFGGRPT